MISIVTDITHTQDRYDSQEFPSLSVRNCSIRCLGI